MLLDSPVAGAAGRRGAPHCVPLAEAAERAGGAHGPRARQPGRESPLDSLAPSLARSPRSLAGAGRALRGSRGCLMNSGALEPGFQTEKIDGRRALQQSEGEWEGDIPRAGVSRSSPSVNAPLLDEGRPLLYLSRGLFDRTSRFGGVERWKRAAWAADLLISRITSLSQWMKIHVPMTKASL
ncbi:unnamed protein product [Lampetra planeri]